MNLIIGSVGLVDKHQIEQNIGNCTGKPPGIGGHTRTRTQQKPVPALTGTGFRRVQQAQTRTHTRAGFTRGYHSTYVQHTSANADVTRTYVDGTRSGGTGKFAGTRWAFAHGIRRVGNVVNCKRWATTWISMALAQMRIDGLTVCKRWATTQISMALARTRINGLTNCERWAMTRISMAFARTRIDGLGLMRACTGCTRGWIGAMREVRRMYERVRAMYERVEV
ncbi:hypothetical protein EV424DRAFT_1352771 [Suillus variegatus]|nr:hypothetical protein EV424DRAFT_1352771 [Suillus variegatus]